MLVGLLLACSTRSPAPPEVRPDILLVVVDTLRADALSAYGNPRKTSPQIDALAAAGVLFEDVTAPGSWTWPSHASLFTGQPPWVHGARTRSVTHSEDDPRLSAVIPMRTDIPTLAGQLSAVGYATQAISENRWLDPALGLTRGFEDVEIVQGCAAVQSAMMGTSDAPQFTFINLMMPHAPWKITPASWVQPHMHLPTQPPHWAAPFVTTEPAGLDLYRPSGPDGQSGFQQYMSGRLDIPPAGLTLIRDLYEGEVAAVDYCLNQFLIAWLEHRPDSIVVVTSDHGEYLGERGLLEHGQTIWREVTTVPLILVAPGRLPAGTRVRTPVQLHDVPGTLLALAGQVPATTSLLPIVQGAERDGPILAAAWHHPDPAADIGGPFEHDWFLYRQGHDALIWSPTGADQLFDLSADPMARDDLAAQHPERVAALRDAAAAAYPLHAHAAPLEIPLDVEQALQEIGYLE